MAEAWYGVQQQQAQPPVQQPVHFQQQQQPMQQQFFGNIPVGELEPWMEENFIKQLFHDLGSVVDAKIVRDRHTGQSQGFGFVEFASHEVAQHVLDTYNGRPVPNTSVCYRLNWGSYGINERKPDPVMEHSVFVGDLSSDVNDYTLLSSFQSRYSSVRSAKVVTDQPGNVSRGYGFVRFTNITERDRAIHEMNGVVVGQRPVRVSFANPKRAAEQSAAPVPAPPPLGMTMGAPPVPGPLPMQPGQPMPMMPPPMHQGRQPAPFPQHQAHAGPGFLDPTDPNNSTIFVGGLSDNVQEEDLRHHFAAFGDIIHTKVLPGKGCGFVQYLERAMAEVAMDSLNGTVLGFGRIRLSWGRQPVSRTPQARSSEMLPFGSQQQWNNTNNQLVENQAEGNFQPPQTQMMLQSPPQPTAALAPAAVPNGVPPASPPVGMPPPVADPQVAGQVYSAFSQSLFSAGQAAPPSVASTQGSSALADSVDNARDITAPLDAPKANGEFTEVQGTLMAARSPVFGSDVRGA